MASPEKLKQIRRARTGVASAAPSPEKTERDLNDPATQEEILHPKPASIKIGGKEYILRKLSARKAREFIGLYEQIKVETVSGRSQAIFDNSGKPRPYPIIDRMCGILARQFSEDFMPLLAASTGEPGAISDDECRKMASDWLETMSYGELSLAFILLCNLNGALTGGSTSPNV